jgi:murein DD-endopeptidase MepM/ murein hydrolase activator NlpD
MGFHSIRRNTMFSKPLRRWLTLTAMFTLLLTLAVLVSAFIPTGTRVLAATGKYYASFAYAIAERVAVVDSGTTADNARAAAESTCRQKGGGIDCQAVGWFTDGWGSFALGPGNQWGWGTDTSLQSADSIALMHCGSGCHLTIRVGISGSVFNWGTGTPLHGNWYIGGFTEGQGDHIRRDYWAVDFYSSKTTVYPTQAGKVVFSDWNCETGSSGAPCYGYIVAIDHANGLYSIYTHLLKTGRPVFGQIVTPSTQIGVMSDTGCSSCGVHLHYAMHIGKSGLTGRLALYDPSLQPVRTPWHKP